MFVKDVVWQMVCYKDVCEKDVCEKDVCERWCVTQLWCEALCERWRVTNRFVNDGVRQRGCVAKLYVKDGV